MISTCRMCLDDSEMVLAENFRVDVYEATLYKLYIDCQCFAINQASSGPHKLNKASIKANTLVSSI